METNSTFKISYEGYLSIYNTCLSVSSKFVFEANTKLMQEAARISGSFSSEML
jgi:hypothetical protein